MRVLIQRVSSASVRVSGEVKGKIGKGILIFLGIGHSDTERESSFLAEKCVNLRIFEDDAGKMNLSLLDIGGSALVISQFTLYGDASKGRRPDFTSAARPAKAIPLYEHFLSEIRRFAVPCESGVFGAEMEVELLNDGPVTILIEKEKP